MSRLRARCPDCRTNTAVAIGPDYQCHSCGREFAAAIVRVPRAWGEGGEAMAQAAHLPLPYPEAAVVDEDTLAMQSLEVAMELPERPIVLGGCCCAHVGAIEALSQRYERLGVVWIDAHGDLNTPATSPSGNAWGMPLRMVIDSGAVAASDAALVGARNLDPPEVEFIQEHGIGDDPRLEGVDAVYVAVDGDGLAPGELAVFMPEPGGPTLAEIERLLREVASRTTVAGAGFSGLLPDDANVAPLTTLCQAVGL
jgi:arginase family enzyme